MQSSRELLVGVRLDTQGLAYSEHLVSESASVDGQRTYLEEEGEVGPEFGEDLGAEELWTMVEVFLERLACLEEGGGTRGMGAHPELIDVMSPCAPSHAHAPQHTASPRRTRILAAPERIEPLSIRPGAPSARRSRGARGRTLPSLPQS